MAEVILPRSPSSPFVSPPPPVIVPSSVESHRTCSPVSPNGSPDVLRVGEKTSGSMETAVSPTLLLGSPPSPSLVPSISPATSFPPSVTATGLLLPNRQRWLLLAMLSILLAIGMAQKMNAIQSRVIEIPVEVLPVWSHLHLVYTADWFWTRLFGRHYLYGAVSIQRLIGDDLVWHKPLLENGTFLDNRTPRLPIYTLIVKDKHLEFSEHTSVPRAIVDVFAKPKAFYLSNPDSWGNYGKVKVTGTVTLVVDDTDAPPLPWDENVIWNEKDVNVKKNMKASPAIWLQSIEGTEPKINKYLNKLVQDGSKNTVVIGNIPAVNKTVKSVRKPFG
eukprot:GHVS01066315.1.p1 GENE.GHVS01066315.1~~GHVS01066315.1.p1  ORF type:complete len:332 (-),score=29.49 GHVS01066315.1:452-1447(-)